MESVLREQNIGDSLRRFYIDNYQSITVYSLTFVVKLVIRFKVIIIPNNVDSHTLVILNIAIPRVSSIASFKYVKNHMKVVNDQ